jgi:5-methylthioadenosine/S-adenosylhomocysteine deaminase
VANDTLREAKALARRRGVRLFVHAAETRGEIGQIARPLGDTPLRHLDALGVLDADTTCVHCVWADETDLDTLARRDAAVVSCPQSNAKLASGVAPLAAMLARGLRIGLGTDGAASNNSLDLFREMDLAARMQPLRGGDPTPVPARRMLDLATRGGAAALGLDTGHGRLTVGAPADLILVDLEQPRLQPFHSPEQLVHAGSGADVRTVIVGGRLVVHERQLRSMDLDETLERVRSLAGRVGS